MKPTDPDRDEHWEHYVATMEGRLASILVDVGLADKLDERTPTQLFEVRLAYGDVRPDGMPRPSETALADEVQRSVEAHCAGSDRYVARVTTAGRRDFYVYSGRPEKEWAALQRRLNAGAAAGRVSISTWEDPGHETYRDGLLPGEDDWQVIRDLQTRDALEAAGDQVTRARPFVHWCYFRDSGAARDFARWACDDERVTDVVERAATGARPYGVQLNHVGTLELADLTHHTLALRRRAAELGGQYDGWECPVTRSSD